jgi:hypothetical protein
MTIAKQSLHFVISVLPHSKTANPWMLSLLLESARFVAQLLPRPPPSVEAFPALIRLR